MCLVLSVCFACAAFGLLHVPRASASEVFSWSKAVNVEYGDQLNAIQCPSTSFCIAVDNNGDVITSGDPFAANATWTKTFISKVNADPFVGLGAISCVGTSMCAAINGDAANVLVSTDPSAAGPTWTTTPGIVTDASELIDISCSTVDLCATDSNATAAVTSPDPESIDATWNFEFDGDGSNAGISCPPGDANLCVVAAGGQISTSVNPGSVAPTWNNTNTPDSPSVGSPTQIYGVACPSSSICLADDNAGNVLLSTAPGVHDPTYKRHNVDGTDGMRTLRCYSTSLCVATDAANNVLVSSDADSPTSKWAATHLDSTHLGVPYHLTDAVCASATKCIATDSFGNVFIGTLKTLGTVKIGSATVKGGAASLPITCPTTGKCAVSLTLTRTVGTGKKAHTAKVGSGSVTAPAGKTTRVTVKLSAAGKKLVKSKHPLRAKLTTKVKLAGKTTTRTQNLTFK